MTCLVYLIRDKISKKDIMKGINVLFIFYGSCTTKYTHDRMFLKLICAFPWGCMDVDVSLIGIWVETDISIKVYNRNSLETDEEKN